MTQNAPLILIIDDEQAILQVLQESLIDEGFRVKTIDNGNTALKIIGELIPDMILLDVFMPNCNGLELLVSIKKEYPQQKVIIISGFGNIPLAVEAIKNDAFDFIEKPLNLDDVLSKLAILKSDYNPTSKTEPLNKLELTQNGIVGEGSLFNELVTQIKNIAQLTYPLLMYGQHGTGKSLFSKYIHQISPLKNLQFTEINCLTTNLNLDANKLIGTLLLKNIDTLTHENQLKLLQFLESNIYQEKTLSGVLRLIVCSNKSLFNMVQNGEWNVQLFYKLNVTPIELPSLNKHKNDIPLLVNHFLNLTNKKLQKNVTLCNSTIRYVRNRDWPGNITELKNFIENIVAKTQKTSGEISLTEIQSFINEHEKEFIEEQIFSDFRSLDEATKAFQKKYITYALKKNHFDLNQLANSLKIDIKTLYNKLNELDVKLK